MATFRWWSRIWQRLNINPHNWSCNLFWIIPQFKMMSEHKCTVLQYHLFVLSLRTTRNTTLQRVIHEFFLINVVYILDSYRLAHAFTPFDKILSSLFCLQNIWQIPKIWIVTFILKIKDCQQLVKWNLDFNWNLKTEKPLKSKLSISYFTCKARFICTMKINEM